MEIPNNCPTREATVQGFTLEIPQPFRPGHECSSAEAGALNQILVENVRNNLAAKIKEMVDKDEATEEACQELLDAYVAEYEFGVRRGRSASGDPVHREALSIATGLVKEQLKARGLKLSEVGQEQIAQLASEAVKKYPQITEQAKQVVALREQAANIEIAAPQVEVNPEDA